MLYRPEAFEPLTDEPWDEARARSAVAEIVADVDEAYDPAGLWPANEWDAWQSRTPLKGLYAGAAGVVWALDVLRRRGHAETRVDLAEAALRALELAGGEPDYSGEPGLPRPAAASLLCGESGMLLVAWRLTQSAELADRLHAHVRANVDNPADELMWGSPGTMLAAHAMHGWTGDERWAEAWRESADALLDRRDGDGLWTQRLYGAEYRMLGPVHGLVGNVNALVQEADERNDALRRETAEILVREAVVEDGLATWPAVAAGELESEDGQIRLQWCHGAPGIVATAAPYLDEELLLAGAELTWRAGAHGPEKGAGVCHGTAGNGWALLKTFERTGDELWLERARRLALHAVAQGAGGTGRYSLWTGDPGVAVFAAACLDADPRVPLLDYWD